MKCKAVIFDIDGTLVDSNDLHARTWHEAFKYFAKEIPRHEIRKQIGMGGDQLLKVFFSPEEIEEKGEAVKEYRDWLFKGKYLKQVKPFPRVADLFARLNAAGKKLALASSAKAVEVDFYIRLLNIGRYLNGHASADDAEKSKPAPDIFEAALKRLGNPTLKTVWVVGDSPFDAIAARKARIKTAGMLCGRFPKEQLTRAGCRLLFKDPSDLLTRFPHSPLSL